MPNSKTLLQTLCAAFCAILCALSGMGGGGMMIGARTAAWAEVAPIGIPYIQGNSEFDTKIPVPFGSITEQAFTRIVFCVIDGDGVIASTGIRNQYTWSLKTGSVDIGYTTQGYAPVIMELSPGVHSVTLGRNRSVYLDGAFLGTVQSSYFNSSNSIKLFSATCTSRIYQIDRSGSLDMDLPTLSIRPISDQNGIGIVDAVSGLKTYGDGLIFGYDKT